MFVLILDGWYLNEVWLYVCNTAGMCAFSRACVSGHDDVVIGVTRLFATNIRRNHDISLDTKYTFFFTYMMQLLFVWHV